jgi:hypothetical protein
MPVADTQDIAALLTRLADRLDRLEAKVDALSAGSVAMASPVIARLHDEKVAASLGIVLERAPVVAEAIAATAQTVFDQATEAGIDPIVLLDAAMPLAAKSARPETLAVLSRALDHADDAHFALNAVESFDRQLASAGLTRQDVADRGLSLAVKAVSPDATAIAGRMLARLADAQAALDRVEQFEKRLADAGVDRDALVDRGLEVGSRLAALATTPEAAALVKGGPFDRETLDIVGKASQALVDVRREKTSPLGLFGTLRAMGEADVQLAVGFGISFLRRFGQLLGRA